jgi:succinate-semialdehyde dehydrogenase/glutarate-semialdehyde dehydrogenase
MLIKSDRVEGILADARVKAATVTGSRRAGSSVAAIAGKHLKKTVLELGGSDPFIVMPSADLERALETAVTARILNNGQSCIAAKRFIVHAEIFDQFAAGFAERFQALRIGDPLEESTEVGPMAMERARRRLAAQVETLIDRGAERLTGAEVIDGPGYFFRPGILCGIARDAPAFDEELFGPVAWLRKVESFDAAIRLANATRYGLGSAIWTQDPDEMERAFREIGSGATFVNALVKSDPRLPFGGVGASGYGRELARDGIIEFVNRKTVVVG